MRQRLISAAVLVPVVVIAFLLGAPWLTFAIALLAAVVSYETAVLATKAGLPTTGWLTVPLVLLLVVGVGANFGDADLALGSAIMQAAYVFTAVIAALAALWFADPGKGLRAWVGTMLATFYPGMLAYMAAFVGLQPDLQSATLFGFHLDPGRLFLLILVLTVWTLDSAAYVVGRYRPWGRFMNHISPNKTWSGAIGGTVAAVIVCALLVTAAGFGPIAGALVGLVIAASAQAGDLVESVLKRAAGVKDSGTLIPGHGGFLDRVDS